MASNQLLLILTVYLNEENGWDDFRKMMQSRWHQQNNADRIYRLDGRKGPKSSEHCTINAVLQAQGYGLIKALRALMAQWKVTFYCSAPSS